MSFALTCSSRNRTPNSAFSISSASTHLPAGNGTAGFSAERLWVAGRWMKLCFFTCSKSSASFTSNAHMWEYMSQMSFPCSCRYKLKLFSISVTSVNNARCHFHSGSISSGTVLSFEWRNALISGSRNSSLVLFRGPGQMRRRAVSGPRAVVWGPLPYTVYVLDTPFDKWMQLQILSNYLF